VGSSCGGVSGNFRHRHEVFVDLSN
jgi:hypothetical protein